MNPLEPFYRAIGAAAPSFALLEGSHVPEPYRRLLVHERDMTSTLEAFIGQPLSLKVLETRNDGTCLAREVVLMGDRDGIPAEFGAIRIFLDQLPLDAARRRRPARPRRPATTGAAGSAAGGISGSVVCEFIPAITIRRISASTAASVSIGL